jgi:hypothetical protein
MPNQEYTIKTTQPQKAKVDAHSYYSSHTGNRGDCCENWSEDDKRCCSCMTTTCIAISVLVIIVKFTC